jgi:hypothetical protein
MKQSFSHPFTYDCVIDDLKRAHTLFAFLFEVVTSVSSKQSTFQVDGVRERGAEQIV